MRTRNIVLLVVGVLALLVVLVGTLAAVIGYVVYQQTKPPPPITISVTDVSALRADYFVDDRIGYQIRLPKNHSVARTSIDGRAAMDATGNPGLVRVYSVARPGNELALLSRATIAAMRVQFHKDGGSDATTVAHHTTTIDGKPAIYAEITWRHASEPMHCMVTIIDEGSSTWYLVLAACPERDWLRMKPAYESSLATFAVGTGGRPITDIAAFNRGDRPTPPIVTRGSGVKPAPPREQPRTAPPVKVDPVAQALKDMAGDNPANVNAALHALRSMEPDPARREVVVAALVKVFDQQKESLCPTAGAALLVWADRTSVPLILPHVASENRAVREGAIRALAGVKDPRAATAVAAQLGKSSHEAGDTLRKMGNVAEDAVIDVLKNGETKAQCQAAKVLGDIGTRDAVEPLREAAKSKEFFLRVDSSNALKRLEARLDKVAE